MFSAVRWTICALGIAMSAAPLDADDDLVASAPETVAQLLKSGGVTLETYDPATAESDLKNYHGSVTFELFLAAPFDVEFRWQPDGPGSRLFIESAFQPVESRITHKIKVPRQLNRAAFWNDSLVRHELDHVAISTDPRTVLLFERTLQTAVALQRKIPSKSKPKLNGVAAIVNEELRLRREAIYELIRRQNRKLDEQTKHGLLPVADRDAFFRELYEKSSLDEASFPFLADVLDLLKEKAYREASPLHVAPAAGSAGLDASAIGKP